MEKKLYTINVYSENIAGLLNQITTIFTRRQLNIETLSVSASSIKDIHKYTITTCTDADTIEKVTKQIEKRIDVVQAHYYTDDEIIYQELALYKVPTTTLLESNNVEQLVRKHNAQILEVNQTYTVIQLSGHPEETQELFEELQPYGLLQFVRSGRIAITKSPIERLSNFLSMIEERQKNMKEESKVGSYDFVAEPFHVDFTGHLTMSVLGNHLLNCAGFHAADRGFGIASLNENHYTWVLSRLAIELEDMPHQYEKFTVQTWVENVYRLFTDRNFAVLDKDGKPIGYARSVWAMIDMQSRKPADLLTLHSGNIVDYMHEKDCPIEKSGRVKVNTETPFLSYETKYSDIDINGHVNSIKYIEHILDLFPIEMFKEKRIRRFEIAYIAESYYGDTLSFYKEDVDENEYHIEIRKNEGEVICRGKVGFVSS